MHINSMIDSKIVMNVAEPECSLTDILNFISDNINKWEGLSECWDLSRINFNSITSTGIKDFISHASTLTQKRIGMKTAIIVENDLGYGMMRMLEMLSNEDFEILIMVFRSRVEAIKWLESST